MLNFIIIIAIIIIFFLTKALIFYFTDINGLPPFLQYQPYSCYKCMSFWTLTFIFATIAICFKEYLFLLGNTLTILDTIALHIYQKNNTIKIDE